jgi:hypothetical protein
MNTDKILEYKTIFHLTYIAESVPLRISRLFRGPSPGDINRELSAPVAKEEREAGQNQSVSQMPN